MRTTLLIFFTFILYIDVIDAQTFEWARGFGASENDTSHSIAVDASGNIYTIGTFEETVDFDSSEMVFNLTSVGESDIYIQKMDPSGNFLWAKSYGSSLNDIGTSVTVDGSGNVYATGYFRNTVNFNPSGENGNFTSAGSNDIFILKLDTLGNFIWAKSFGDATYDVGLSIALDQLENIYIAGSFSGTVNFNSGGADGILVAGEQPAFVLKLNTLGNFLWAKSFGGRIWDMDIDIMGNVYTIGSFQDTADFDPGEDSFLLTTPTYMPDVFIHKMDSFGNFLWAKSFGGNDEDSGRAIAVDEFGNIYTTGYFRYAVDFDPGDGISVLSASGYPDIFVQKLDTSGSFLWAKSFGGTLGIDWGTAITTDIGGDFYLAGTFSGTVNFIPESENGTLTSQGASDIFIQKMDALGNGIWVNSVGGSLEDSPARIIADSNGNIYCTGSFSTIVDFDFGSEMSVLTSSGYRDAFILKLNSNPLGIDQFNWDSNIIAYPNPTYSELKIKSEKVLQRAQLILSNIQGQQLFCQTFDVLTEAIIKMPDEAGIYFLSVEAQENKRTIKIVRK
ncbi:SBBP repeat-containing protein [Subsaxibacter sp. CAU 1640]|uniref:SBBP repeat-containing protein n=1 Tax=Subsaxibacter sp. CAU 1640 TaxID=2933271 RepID=UPI0020064253|nr:SBBP repeat-containing protein [Subsaxibacter sp. CAU 1640]MCK7591597.1 SBBP repeat-containing protein [Subsaxibacter sp. CAU 1640]